MKIIGYSYEAGINCLDCTKRRYPDLSEDTLDREGNEVIPVYDIEEIDGNEGVYCDCCFCEIREPYIPL